MPEVHMKVSGWSRVWRKSLLMSFVGATLMAGGVAAAAPRGASASVMKSSHAPGVLSAGYSHSLSLGPNGTVWAWGSNAWGELGNGTVGSTATPLPVEVSGLKDVVAVAAGSTFSLALREDGTVWAWGNNERGQVGNGTFGSSAVSSPVQVSGLTDVVAIAVTHNSCLALRSDGTVWAWGWNGSGMLGVGLSDLRVTTPAQVVGLTDVAAIAGGGGGFSLALRSDGTVWAWGLNGSRQLGANAPPYRVVSTPLQVPGLEDVVSIAAGWAHAMALCADGTVRTWGHNYYGQLGDGASAMDRAAAAAVPGLEDVVAIIAGPSSFRAMALRRDGSVWAWGINTGDGTSAVGRTPEQVLGVQEDVVSLASGSHALLLGRDGTLWGWGQNSTGALGDGTTLTRYVPGPVSGLTCRLAGVPAWEDRAGESVRCLDTP